MMESKTKDETNQGKNEGIRTDKATYLTGYQSENFLKQISEIQYPNLKNLTFSDNRIESIEGIHRIWMPILNELWIDGNFLTKVNSLYKANWRNMKTIVMIKNKIKDPNCLFKVHFPLFQYNSIEFFNEQEQQFPDMTWFVKKQERTFIHLRIRSEKRLKIQKLKKQFVKKYPNLDF